MSIPIITHSEITDNIYIVCGGNKYNVTEQVIKAMRETGRLEQRPHGEWTYHKYDKDYECSSCGVRFDEEEITVEIPQENHNWVRVCRFAFCPMCGSDNRKEGEAE